MQIIIGYDGSGGADAAIDDLRRAGLPERGNAALISVADVWPRIPDSMFQPRSAQEAEVQSPTLRRARELADLAMRQARTLAQQGAARLAQVLADWSIEPLAMPGSPADVIIQAAQDRKAELIVVGSRGCSTLGRWMLGSVSHRVLAHAHCSVRIGRPTSSTRGEEGAGARLLVGIDGSAGAAAAVRAIATRRWPAGTLVRAVMTLPEGVSPDLLPVIPSTEHTPDEQWGALARDREWLDQVSRQVLAELSAASLKAEFIRCEGDARQVLLDEAAKFRADTLFVGARGLRAVERFLLGSVSTAVAEHAQCTVEVVRPSSAISTGTSPAVSSR